MLRELFDGVAPVAKNSRLPVNKGHRALALGGVSKASVKGEEAGFCGQPRDIEAELVLPSTARRLERGLPIGRSLFDEYSYVIVSTDFIKSDRRRDFDA